MIKLTIIKTNPDWLEASWVDEVVTTTLVENIVNDEIVEETVHNTETTILHSESFSGHKEHIRMLLDKCAEFGTELTNEDEAIIKEISEAFIYPDEDEIQAEAIQHQVNEYKSYLSLTDYKMTVDYFATLSKEVQDDLTTKRAEAREFVRANKDKVK